MKPLLRIFLLLLVLNGLFATVVKGQVLPSGFEMEKIVSDLNPVAMTIDHLDRIWIVEKQGRILIVENGNVLEQPFLTLAVDDFNERGLLGVALHPDFATNGYVYIFYTVVDLNRNRVSRVRANGDTAIPGSEEIILEMGNLSGSVHNGGAMVFDDEGYLYIATGDESSSTDAQRLDKFNGKILRLHDDGSIPEDNPFYNVTYGKYRSIYSYGLRNPFSMMYDHHSNQIFVSDVGQGSAEEVNIIKKGKNYGWPIAEGYWTGEEIDNYEDPFYAYSHDEGCAIIGAAVLNHGHSLFPEEYLDAFYFADYCEGFINYIQLDGSLEVNNFGTSPERPLAIHFSEDGEMYLLTREGLGGGSTADNTLTFDGALWKINFTGSGAANIISHSEDKKVVEGENAIFLVNFLGDQPFTFEWLVNGYIDTSAQDSIYVFENITKSQDSILVQCIVSNNEGRDTSGTMQLFVIDGSRPQPEILFPFENSNYKAGDTIFFSGMAYDEGILMNPAQLTWNINQHHNEHFHPIIQDECCTSSGWFVIPTNGETSPDVWVRLTLSALDSSGLVASTALDIYPDMTILKIDGPEDATINVDGSIYNLPTEILSMKGIDRIMTVPQQQVIGDSIYIFDSWENGSTEPTRYISTPSIETEYTVNFTSHVMGVGIGLLGEYYNDLELDLDGLPEFSRIDSIVKFNWGSGSPDSDIEKDYFTVRWSGFVEPVFNEEYTFYTFSDDGVRLYISDSLLIDEWHTQSPKEYESTIELEAGRKYKIVLEYMEATGGSIIELKWSSRNTTKQIIPKRQLYPVAPHANIIGEVYLDLNNNGFFDIEEEGIDDIPVFIYSLDNEIVDIRYTDQSGMFSIDQIDSGYYFLHINAFVLNNDFEGLSGVDEQGYTPLFRLEPSQVKYISVPFGLITSNADIPVDDDLIVAPNPFLDGFRIISSHTIDKLVIYDKSFNEIVSVDSHTESIYPHLIPGLYWLKIFVNENVYWRKVICIH